jgi:hypothetical protein
MRSFRPKLIPVRQARSIHATPLLLIIDPAKLKWTYAA